MHKVQTFQPFNLIVFSFNLANSKFFISILKAQDQSRVSPFYNSSLLLRCIAVHVKHDAHEFM